MITIKNWDLNGPVYKGDPDIVANIEIADPDKPENSYCICIRCEEGMDPLQYFNWRHDHTNYDYDPDGPDDGSKPEYREHIPFQEVAALLSKFRMDFLALIQEFIAQTSSQWEFPVK
ncbi:hypothetical protein COV82_05650 [Candidatus Peregrinibacteria bacterium CG11_big_fil_rev_8_21_14_0_20_46_8]|nr:MAG: hypothetical protein COV82_05650 [Candidatus Peregrinibacteria bacterium CG11_big_fil_rev_8_21_14_0_20_46_8]